ncbi:DarT ssDNA thymidine ADP-ribosyltransferase family protein [Brucella lupini]
MAISTLAQIASLYHFTDVRNIESIRQMGGLHPYSSLLRQSVDIPAPGGNAWSHDSDQRMGVDSDIHLCFRPSHPMEQVARNDNRIGQVTYLQIDPCVLFWPNVRFTPDVSNKAGVIPVPIGEAEQMLDFEVLYSRTDWRDPAIMTRLKSAEKCEVLVPHVIPLNLIRNI